MINFSPPQAPKKSADFELLRMPPPPFAVILSKGGAFLITTV